MIQTLTLEFEEGTVRVFVQILELEKQTYVYVGMGSLDSMSVAVPGIGQEETTPPASTIVLSSREMNADSKRLSDMLCRKSGTSVVASYNIPPQDASITESMKQQIFAALVKHIC
mmetsp:Transcript_10674/g.21148  ORF Transcript_10674/g.21148 Transcript_10674/m.21148 type:complete len:115 (+) Transcript_10674:2101-2445(+)